MTNSQNRYAPPKTFESDAHASDYSKGVWRDGKDLVTLQNALLPPRCVKCNEPGTAGKKPVQLWWHHGAIYLFVLLSPIVYLIVALIARKGAVVTPSLCNVHKNQRTQANLIAWIGSLGTFILCIYFASVGQGALALMSVAGFITCIAIGLIRGRTLTAKRIDKVHVRMGGCGEDFLDSLPPIPE
jgi:hypothetical protein